MTSLDLSRVLASLLKPATRIMAVTIYTIPGIVFGLSAVSARGRQFGSSLWWSRQSWPVAS